ncbi:MAG TPA: ATP-binding protein [Streptosporangiaceae bacterium]|nr:ATP-binding protein [Streptosporangiaceae bacterium]
MSGSAGAVPVSRPAHKPSRDAEHRSVAGTATTLTLGPLPSAVPCARAHAVLVVHGWGLGHLADSVAVVVSELTTNAVQATTGAGLDGHTWQGTHHYGRPPVRLALSTDGESVLVEVWDANEGEPAPQQPGPDDMSGRGLVIVGALAEETGTSRLEGTTGKVVWALVRGGA